MISMTTLSERDSSPWDSISMPKSDYAIRRVAEKTGVPLNWGRDSAGHCLLIVELNGDHTEQFRQGTSRLHGIDVDLRSGECAGQQRLVLTLARQVDADLFLSLCQSLIVHLAQVTDSASALSLALTHLKRWKAFLAGKQARLSPEEVHGLFAELHALHHLCAILPHDEAVRAWTGADDAQQDFMFGNRAVEVKALSGKARGSVRISSEDQLDTVLEHLFLLTVHLSEMPGDDLSRTACSLNESVARIERELSCAWAVEAFADKLANRGYVPLPDYDRPRFAVLGTQGHRVTEDFPRLIRANMPLGIVRVCYDIHLETITAFRCSNEDIWGVGIWK
jgi:hypothetical protein